MISRLPSLFRTAADARRLSLFALHSAFALVVGFVIVSPRVAERLLVQVGYYYILGLFAIALVYGWRVAWPRREAWLRWLRRPGLPGVVLAAATVVVIWGDSFEHKVIYDEYVLQGTAWHMHATKEVGTPIRAFDIFGHWQTVDTFLDKRPFFFTFLVSLLHDLSGFRIANAFVLNAVLAPICLALVYWLARTVTTRGPALLAVVLLATLPLFAQNATGAGMEMHNLTMIALLIALSVLYLRAPDNDRLSLLIIAALLLAQSRYESVLFVIPVGAVAIIGWLKAGRPLLPWIVSAAPILLVPYAWHSRVVSSRPVLWQLREGETDRFSLQYLPGNLEGAWKFFFNASGKDVANSWCLSVLGIAGLGWALLRAWRWARKSTAARASVSPAVTTFVAFAATVGANLALLMLYYWSRLDEPIAARFALPACLVLALLIAWFVQDLETRRIPAMRIAAAVVGVWLLGWGMPTYARRLYTAHNHVLHEIEWELEQLRMHPGPLLLITNKATVPFLLERISVLNIMMGRTRGPQLAWHLREGTFREVLVSQIIRPTSAQGDKGIEPDDMLPETFRLESVAEKRFGGRWLRISRLVALDEQPAIPAYPRSDSPTRDASTPNSSDLHGVRR